MVLDMPLTVCTSGDSFIRNEAKPGMTGIFPLKKPSSPALEAGLESCLERDEFEA